MDTTALIVVVVVLPLVGLVFSVMRVLSAYWLKKHMTDQALAEQLSSAFNNALGAVQQGTERMLIPPSVAVQATVPERLQPGVQYVINNAEEALQRWPMSPERMAEKIVAREGLKEIETNLAVSGSEVPMAVPPLAPVGTTTEELNKAELARVRGG